MASDADGPDQPSPSAALPQLDGGWFHAFMEHSPSTAFIKDAEGRLLYINPPFVDAFDFHDRDWFGKTDFELWPKETAEVLRANDLRILESGIPQSVEETVTHADGEHTWVTVKFRIEDNSGRRFLAGMGMDRTEHRRLESALAQAGRLDSIGQLAGGVAHDFNNLLTSVLGNCELALREPDATARRERLLAIREAAKLGGQLTQKLLGFARKQDRCPTTIEVNSLVEGLAPILRRVVQKDVALELELDSSPGFVTFDAGQMEQVILNLVVNASEAMPSGGEVVIRTGTKVLTEPECEGIPGTGPGEHVVIQVQDSGQGIPPDELAKIFEPFFTTKPRGHGTGLGLATVHGIARQNGAGVTVESKVGVGSTFDILVPISQEELDFRASEARETEPPAPSDETILYVEDEALVRDAISALLESHGYNVLTASSGEEALGLASESSETIDLVITDVVMEGIGGAQLAARIRQSDPDLPVLFVSGYTAAHLSRQGRLSANTRLLSKPFSHDQLGRTVREILDEGRESP